MIGKYKPIGELVTRIDSRNTNNIPTLLGVSINKCFIPSVANTIGTDLSNYKVIRKNDFAVSLMQVSRDSKIPIACLKEYDEAIMSPAYSIFRVKNTEEILPDYLDMWFKRSEFDRECAFIAVGGVRGSMPWEEFAEIKVFVPNIDEQEKFVHKYQVIFNRIALKQRINDNLVQILQNIYQDMFKNKEYNFYPLVELCSKIGSGATPKGGKESYHKYGTSLIRSTNVFDFRFSYNDLAHIDENQANELKNVTVIENDVLFNITGVSIARCCIVPRNVLPARVNQHVMILRPIAGKFMSYYLMFTLCYTDNKSVLLGIGQSGSTREAINKQEIEMFQIPVPSNDEIIAFGKIAEKFYKQMESNNSEVSHLLFMQNLILSTISRR